MNKRNILSKPSRAAIRITLLYLGFSILWICFSDWAVLFFIKNAELLNHFQAGKGWFYVTITALFIFLLLEKEIRRYEMAAEALRASENYLGSIFRAAPIGIGVVSDRIFRTVNDRIGSMTGYSQEELIGQNSRMLYCSDAEYIAVGTEKYLQIGIHGTGTVETRWQRKDGQFIDVLLSSTPINPLDLGAGVTFTALDITASKKAEAALRESEERYRGLIELAVDGILLGSHEGVIIDANQHMCTMIAMERDDIIGRHISALPFIPESIEKTPFRFDLLQKGEAVISERTLTRPDGVAISFEMRTKMMPDGTYQSIYRDITERKRVENALRESEEKFALAFTASPDAVNINRLADGLYVEINKGFTDLTGFTGEDVYSRTSSEINIWCDSADRQRLVKSLGENGYCDNLEARFRRKDGSLATGLMSARMIVLNHVPHIISITRDITQRKQDEADRERLKVAIEHAGEAIVITDAQGNIQYANPAFEHVTGYTFKEAHLQNPRILKSGLHGEAFFTELWNTISSGRTWTGRLINKNKFGILYTEEATISPVFDAEGKIVNYVAIKRDITAQLKLEDQFLQAQKMESVGRLTGGVAHDFNNILAVIIGYTEIAMDLVDPSQRLHSHLEKIYEAAERSADIVRQLLAFSRKQTITPKVLDLNSSVSGLLKMLHRLIGEDIVLAWMPAPDLSPVKMDPAQIDQILVNLCVNARDAINEIGKITIATQGVSLDENVCGENLDCIPGTYAVLSVSDTGCGMEQAVIDKIFEPFFTTKELLGTGLGLSTVYGIVKQNNGFIRVASAPGEGATFKVYLPIHADAEVRSKEAFDKSPAMSRGETLFLVEDDKLILEMSSVMLEKLGYRVLAADSPREALRLAAEHTGRIELLITDVIMPEMNGKELSKQLLALHPELKLLYMSGYTADVIAHHGVLDQGVHFLQKPFLHNDLSVKVREVLDEQGA
jgi:PAS domain S-box-containing protein